MSDSDGAGGSTASSRKRANSSGGDRSSPSPPRNGAASYAPPGVSTAPAPAPAPAPTPTPTSKKKQKKGSRGSSTGVQAFVPPVWVFSVDLSPFIYFSQPVRSCRFFLPARTFVVCARAARHESGAPRKFLFAACVDNILSSLVCVS